MRIASDASSMMVRKRAWASTASACFTTSWKSRPTRPMPTTELARGGQRRGEERRRPSLEERDERHGNGLRVDVDPLGGLDARGDEHHGEPAEGRADEQRASAYVPRGPRLEPPIGARVEERAEDQDT